MEKSKPKIIFFNRKSANSHADLDFFISKMGFFSSQIAIFMVNMGFFSLRYHPTLSWHLI